VQDQGRYQDLTLSSEAFRAMARLSPSDASVEA
jgi:hypothetical protein